MTKRLSSSCLAVALATAESMSVAVAQIAVIDGPNLDKRQEDEQHSTKSDEAKKDETDRRKASSAPIRTNTAHRCFADRRPKRCSATRAT